jgi:transglutaminase-like putative cysteine protease
MEWKTRRYPVKQFLNICTYAIALLGFVSVAPQAGMIFSFCFCALAGTAIIIDVKRRAAMPGFIVQTLAVLIVFITFFRLSKEAAILPGIEAALILMGLKLLDRKKPRDYIQIFMIAIFILAGLSLLSLDMIFIFYLLLMVLLLGIAIVLLAYDHEDETIALPGSIIIPLLGNSLWIPLLVIPLSLILFVLLPRTSYPFFSFLNQPAQVASGFSDQVKLGSVSQIQLDNSLVFRVAMARIEERDLYWRGIVFDVFDGVSWQSSGEAGEITQGPVLAGRKVTYTIYLEPSEYATLFTLDRPAAIFMRYIDRYEDMTFKAREPLAKKIRYDALSVLTETTPAADEDLARYLSLPEGTEEIQHLASKLTAGKHTDAMPMALVSFLKDGQYRYSLRDLPKSRRPLQDFLFHNRTGNCEYFASALAVMLRTQGVPTRLVGGYRGGYYNEMGQYYALLQLNAHVWVEALHPGRGWVRYDPTPAFPSDAGSVFSRSLSFRLRMMFDILEYYWNRHVINYDLQQQYKMFINLSRLLPGTSGKIKFPANMMYWLTPFIMVLLLVFALKTKQKWPPRKTAEEKLLAELLTIMDRRGYEKKACDGLEEFLARVPAGQLRIAARDFVNIFQDAYYHDRAFSEDEIQRLRAIIVRIRN